MEPYEYIFLTLYIMPEWIMEQYKLIAMEKMDMSMLTSEKYCAASHSQYKKQTTYLPKILHHMDIASVSTHPDHRGMNGDR